MCWGKGVRKNTLTDEYKALDNYKHWTNSILSLKVGSNYLFHA